MTVLLADPNPFTMKLLRDLSRECRIRHVVEVSAPGDLAGAVAGHVVDIFVIDQRILDEPESPAWNILQARTGADGMAPALLLFGLPRMSALTRARQNGIGCALAKPFAPNDYWMRLQWLARRVEPTISENTESLQAQMVG